VKPSGEVPREIEAVLLDGLGTLVALQAPAAALVEALRDSHAVELSLADAERAFGAEIAYYRAHHREGRDRDSLRELRHRCARVLRAQLPPAVASELSPNQATEALLCALRFAAYPDAHGALAGLRARGLALVVVSNWDASLPAVLRDVGLEGMVDGVVTSAEVGHEKPAREIFAAALSLTGTPPRRTLHVGDSIEHDVEGARAAGIRALLLRRGEADGESPYRGAPTIRSLGELLA